MMIARNEFDVKKFEGVWKEFERYVKPGEDMLYPDDALDVTAEYRQIHDDPLEISVRNSYTWLGVIPLSIDGVAVGEGRKFDVTFSKCCITIGEKGVYEVLDFTQNNGIYTHLFVGSGDDRYRWILVRDLNNIDWDSIRRFKRMFPNREFIRTNHS